MSPQTGQIWTHDRKGGRYEIIYCCDLRNYDDGVVGKWRVGVVYKKLYKNYLNVYVRNLPDFIKNFTQEKK